LKKCKIHSAIVLSAGYGKRLRPITDSIPKPLLPIGNQLALDRIIQVLLANSITDFYFNTFHLADKVTGFLNEQSDLNKTIVNERNLRGTGGGIANFKESLHNRSFIVHNCDIYTEENLSNLIEFHFRHDSPATLMVTDFPVINTVVVKNNEVKGFSKDEGNFTYCGVAVFSPVIWEYFPDREVFSLVSVLKNAIQNGERIAAYDSCAYWNDFGTSQRYWELHNYLALSSKGNNMNSRR